MLNYMFYTKYGLITEMSKAQIFSFIIFDILKKLYFFKLSRFIKIYFTESKNSNTVCENLDIFELSFIKMLIKLYIYY